MSSATEKAYDHIKGSIMSGNLNAGDRIKEEILAEEIGVSRTPIRQALQKLAVQGFVDMSHNQGAKVARWSSQQLHETADLRALLEGFGAGVAARNITDALVKKLTNLADQMEQASERGEPQDLEAITGLNSQFHMTIIEASGNRLLGEVIGSLAHPLLVRRRFSSFSPRQLQRSMSHHREIVEALIAGDTEWAAAVMRSHILASNGKQSQAISDEQDVDREKSADNPSK